jgi:hypothetical protein
VHVNAQTTKPKFKKIIMVTYRIDQSGKNQRVIIESYREINENGQFHLIIPYYNGIADTAFQLSDNNMLKFNKIFDGSRKLKSYMVTNKLSGSQHFDGELEFISCTYNDNTVDNFIVIAAFMDKSFCDVLFYQYPWPSKVAYKGKTINNQFIESQILKYHNTCTYIPKTDEPPAIK